jgi:predicted nucleotidyltransferase
MGTPIMEVNIASVLFGRVRLAVLTLLFGNPDREFYLREIVRAAGVGQGAIQRELASLVSAGLVQRLRRGSNVFYSADRQSLLFDELHSLVMKTSRSADILKAALEKLTDQVAAAFIYGSVAKGTEKAASDIDLMVIGSVSFAEVVSALLDAQEWLGREINPSVFSADEFRRRAVSGDHFISTVMNEPKIFLLGSDNELRELAE